VSYLGVATSVAAVEILRESVDLVASNARWPTAEIHSIQVAQELGTRMRPFCQRTVQASVRSAARRGPPLAGRH